MKEVYPGIFLIEEKGKFRPSDNIFIIAGNDGIIFDAGYGNKRSIKQFLTKYKEIEDHYKELQIDFRITRITVSHAHSDHFSGLNKISSALGLKIILTKNIANKIKDKISFNKSFQVNDYEDNLKLNKNMIRKIWKILRDLGEQTVYKRIFGISYLNKPDKIIEENSVIWINGEKWSIFASPGHSPDHISLYNEEKGVLFSGDNVLNMRSTWLGPPESNIDDYLATIQQFQKLPKLELILPAHGDIIKNPKETLTAILERMKEREDQLINVIKKRSEDGLSPEQLTKIIYPKQRKFVRIIARDWIMLTLKKLEREGIIKRNIMRKKILFLPVEDR
ncbi:MAG: MBL fold metallo-hydrolase [Candidatus Thorarchaeota archaeon]